MSTASTASCSRRKGCRSVGQPLERAEGRLLPAVHCHQPGLPAGERGLVADQKPDHHVDPRILARDRESLCQVLGLQSPGDAELGIGRVGLVAVLGDPELLRAIEPRDLGRQRVDVRQRDRGRCVARAGRRRLGRRGLGRHAVVRVVRVGVEGLHPGSLRGVQECDRRDRRAHAPRIVVPARARYAARDLLALEHRRVHAGVDGVADLRVGDRALDHPLTALAHVLRPQYVRKGGKWVIQSAVAYAKICNAVYTGVHSTMFQGEQVACGVTGPRGNNNPGSVRPSVSPIAFLDAAKRAGMKTFDAYAHNPYYGVPTETPTTKPPPTSSGHAPTAVTLANIDTLTTEVSRLYGPKKLWITEYGYQTNPPDPQFGISWALQAKYLTQAFAIAHKNPRIDIMIWFLVRDEPSLSGWQSGLVTV